MKSSHRASKQLNKNLFACVIVLVLAVAFLWLLPFFTSPSTISSNQASIPLGQQNVSQLGQIQGQNQYSPQNPLPLTREQLDQNQVPVRQP